MQKWEEDILLKEQGKAEERDYAVKSTIAALKKYNVSREEIIEEISTSYPDYADKVADLI